MSIWNYILDNEISQRSDIEHIRNNMAYSYELEKIDIRSRKGVKHDRKQDAQLEVIEEKLNDLIIFQKAFMKYMDEDKSFNKEKFINILSDLTETE